MVGGDWGQVHFVGPCRLTTAQVGPHPEGPSLAIVDTNWQPPAGRHSRCPPMRLNPCDVTCGRTARDRAEARSPLEVATRVQAP